MAKARPRTSRGVQGDRWVANRKVTPTPTGKAPGALWYRPKHGPPPGRKPRPKRKARPTGPREFVKRYKWALIGVPVFLLLSVLTTLMIAYASLDIPGPPHLKQTSYLYDRNGKLITTLHLGEDRTPVPFSDMPKVLRQAVIATEDAGYYNHGGISPMAILRAAWADLTNREFVQGGSTITQQYVKNAYTGSERSLFRKIKEAMLAIKLEHKFTKNQILEKYLNTVYFGHGAYGVEAAAKTYFGIHARDLNLLQSATLAGTIAAPSRFDFIDHPSDGFVRRNYVLDRMAEEGFITLTKAEHLKRKKITTVPQRGQSTKAPYFIDYAVKWLKDRFGKRAVYSGGLRVTTTVDLDWQQAAEQAIHSHLPLKTDPSAVLVAIDPRTGGVRALAGQRQDFLLGDFNPAFQGSGRQTGSAYKMFTLTAAFAQHISPYSYWDGPSEITIEDPRCYTNGEPWSPSNYADEGEGTMNLLSATANSVNTIFSQLVVALKNGPEDVVTMSHKLGIRSPLEPVCSITLGTQDVHPVEMANAYATIAAHGMRHWARPIQKVTRPDGAVLARPHGPGFRAVQPNIANMVTYALEGVINSGTGTAASIGRPAAGKTGTGENYTNAWFCGYVPQLAACVWVGYPKGSIPLENVEGFSTVFGGSIPAEIWHDFMAAATADMPVQDFVSPFTSEFSEHPDTAVAPPPPPAPSPSPSPSPSPKPSPKPSFHPTPTPRPTTPPPSPSPTAPPTPGPTLTPPAPP